MNKFRVYKSIEKKMTPTLDTGCQVGSVTVSRYQSIPDSVRTRQSSRIGEVVLHFSWAIALGIPGSGVQVSYFQFLEKVPIDSAVKLRPII